MSSFLAGPIGVAYHVVIAFAHVLAPLTGGAATAAAIVAFTVAVRLLLAPLSFYGLRGQARIAAVQPRLQELRTRYARQPERLQSEVAALYAQEAGGMLRGCLPLLLQLPFFSVMYRLFLSRTVDGRPNGLLSQHLLGTPLGSHLLTGAGLLSSQGLVFLGLFIVLALVATLSVRAAKAAAPVAPAAGGGAPVSGAMGAIMKLLPYSTLIIAAFVPLAAGLYLLTTTTWTVAERVLLRRWIAPGQLVGSPQAGGRQVKLSAD